MTPLTERFGLLGWLAAGAVALVAIGIGFFWLPSLQANAQGGLWDAICRAVGISGPARLALAADASVHPATDLTWNEETLRVISSGDAQRGSALAAGCVGCHGANGVSPSDAFPNIAGIPAAALYKQLDDYKTGRRQNPIMQGMAAALDEKKMADLAAHFAALPKSAKVRGDAPPVLVAYGGPLRSIAPCAACHGPLGHKPGAPPLDGQKGPYLKAQLDAFATGARRNDINEQMREVARALTPTERDALVAWYGGG
jgi:cytochrome c553